MSRYYQTFEDLILTVNQGTEKTDMGNLCRVDLACRVSKQNEERWPRADWRS